MPKPAHPPFSADAIEAIANKVLADTKTGLTGTEIEHALANCKDVDTGPSMTKWKRLDDALRSFEDAGSCSKKAD